MAVPPNAPSPYSSSVPANRPPAAIRAAAMLLAAFAIISALALLSTFAFNGVVSRSFLATLGFWAGLHIAAVLLFTVLAIGISRGRPAARWLAVAALGTVCGYHLLRLLPLGTLTSRPDAYGLAQILVWMVALALAITGIVLLSRQPARDWFASHAPDSRRQTPKALPPLIFGVLAAVSLTIVGYETLLFNEGVLRGTSLPRLSYAVVIALLVPFLARHDTARVVATALAGAALANSEQTALILLNGGMIVSPSQLLIFAEPVLAVACAVTVTTAVAPSAESDPTVGGTQ